MMHVLFDDGAKDIFCHENSCSSAHPQIIMVTETTPLFDDKTTIDSHQVKASVRRSSVSNSFREHHGAVPLPSKIPLEGLSASAKSQTEEKSVKGGFFYYLVYAAVNVIISVPGLYGYASVIFRHEAYADHMNALSKLVIFSSFVHQLGFVLFSSLPFAIGTVQDAG